MKLRLFVPNIIEMTSKIVIFKNDRIGDLIPSVPAINLIIDKNKDKKIVFIYRK